MITVATRPLLGAGCHFFKVLNSNSRNLTGEGRASRVGGEHRLYIKENASRERTAAARKVRPVGWTSVRLGAVGWAGSLRKLVPPYRLPATARARKPVRPRPRGRPRPATFTNRHSLRLRNQVAWRLASCRVWVFTSSTVVSQVLLCSAIIDNLGITDRLPGRFAQPTRIGKQAADFIDQSGGEHGLHAAVDAVLQFRPSAGR